MRALLLLLLAASILGADDNNRAVTPLPDASVYAIVHLKDGRALTGWWDADAHRLKIVAGTATSEVPIDPSDVVSTESATPPAPATAKDPMAVMQDRIAALEREVSVLRGEIDDLKSQNQRHRTPAATAGAKPTPVAGPVGGSGPPNQAQWASSPGGGGGGYR